MYPQMSLHPKRTGAGVGSVSLVQLREVYNELSNRRDENRSLWRKCECGKQDHRIAVSVPFSKRPTVIFISRH